MLGQCSDPAVANLSDHGPPVSVYHVGNCCSNQLRYLPGQWTVVIWTSNKRLLWSYCFWTTYSRDTTTTIWTVLSCLENPDSVQQGFHSHLLSTDKALLVNLCPDQMKTDGDSGSQNCASETWEWNTGRKGTFRLGWASQEGKEIDCMWLPDLRQIILNFHHKIKIKTLINILFPLKQSWADEKKIHTSNRPTPATILMI